MVVSSGIQRRSKALKNKWEKIKKNVKQRLSEEKKEIYITGRGVVKTFKNIDYYDNILELLGVSSTGLASDFDSDIVDLSLNNLRQTTTTTLDNNEVDDLVFVLEKTNSPNMFDDSEFFNQTTLNVVTVEQLEVTPSTSRKTGKIGLQLHYASQFLMNELLRKEGHFVISAIAYVIVSTLANIQKDCINENLEFDGDLGRLDPVVAFVYRCKMCSHLEQILKNDAIQLQFRTDGRFAGEQTPHVAGRHTVSYAARHH
ncbi:uncharacterized protein LOC132936855 [Metopolophium dirhodum]|uniref:uncharacterized protein LOC132936369 n=1 Tax=Metopolophium dirhodum TaxID=44670 RepID=UPI0029906600|nr:uncharacterized protein LOC132936369 [Metopolophium dirhodum]XP_060859625.1 uncharacterized protein LOC132936855 [Metopolophium dirhodum]